MNNIGNKSSICIITRIYQLANQCTSLQGFINSQVQCDERI